MQRYAFTIQYKGTNYFGWQRQINQISVQEKIEKTFCRLYNIENCPIVGCGRTDSGVHASHYVFHVDLSEKFSLEDLSFKINRMLPEDISVLDVRKVASDFHARFDAIARTYIYKIARNKDPFSSELNLYYTKELQLEKMNLAASFLLGRQDFTSFSKLHTDVKTNFCTISEAKWFEKENGNLYFQITADRFLRNMVRAIVGSLLEVGEGKIDASEIQNIITKKDRCAAKASAPAHALYLSKIEYKGF